MTKAAAHASVGNRGRKRRIRQALLRSVVGLLLLLGVVGALAALSNLGMPTHSLVVDRLGALEKARLAEAFHLRRTLGDRVWPGWGSATIPAVVYNEGYVFLVGYPDPPAGWRTVPDHRQHGGPWEPVANDQFAGAPYYRQQLFSPEIEPQSFIVLVGDRWVSSLGTKEWMVISLGQQVREDFGPLFPYRLFTRLLIGSSETYIGALLHESFHAYQGMVAPTRLESSETIARQHGDQYPVNDAAHQQAWQTELNLLADALNATSPEESSQLARQFLAQRAKRRTAMALTPALIEYECQREWLEGLAKYAELAILRQAAAGDSYTPLPAIAADDDFSAYSRAERYWSQQVAQIRRMAGDEGDGRFYYSGMAQAFLLDRLLPGWEERIISEDVTLEELLDEAVPQS